MQNLPVLATILTFNFKSDIIQNVANSNSYNNNGQVSIGRRHEDYLK